MTTERKLPIGVQSFVRMREDNFIYVDKTNYIYELLKGRQYFLSRPRRFGKSLFLSTLKAYWEGQRELFEGLKIVELEKDNADAFAPYPVFYFDFNGQNYQNNTALEDILSEHLKKWEEIYGGDSSLSLSARFRDLLIAAKTKTGKGCVVLVDEYDKSLLETMENAELLEHNKAVFKGFFGVLKSFDEYLRFVFITGVTKFSKTSIFSDLNQLNDISLNKKYEAVCGITEKEIKEFFAPEVKNMSENLGISNEECLLSLKEMYDGYHFHSNGEGVYNPFSLLNSFDENELGSYWFSTGTPTFLVERVRKIHLDTKRFTDCTLYADKNDLTDYRYENPNPIPLLYQTGYLTILNYDKIRKHYVLGFPNNEVKYGFLKHLLPVYTPKAIPNTGTDIFALSDAIEVGDTEQINDIFTALFASIPYTTNDAPFEHYFQTVIYLVFTLLGQYVKCEVHSSKGRADSILETDNFVYIFEFKVDKPAGEALKQIEEKGYAEPYKADTRQIFKIGVSFDSKERHLVEWLTEE